MVGEGSSPKMKEVTYVQDLVDSLLNAGDKLVIVDFFSPGCGGCKALHPKLKWTYMKMTTQNKIKGMHLLSTPFVCRKKDIRNLLMGSPKQKWTAEEEAALKVGVLKHGIGKWCNIRSDPEFSSVLRSRSNVDLKLEFYNTLCEVNSPLKNYIHTVLASGILHLENGSYKIDSWDGKVPDVLAKCNLILRCT
ncbi:hypothetical protein F3Y22_tig00000340pilonHSYRG01003 [Hibiscus syriacus]|uniref:MYB transcription factor n=1 Tax=Hibiscus syriacus TaxID=106335 RepID=A0A6A3D4Q8_HIBSY|nr:hypothetical protein F3Y22_tig00000340pilonHSYRG01003 [Hibiscus syriacus]